MLDRYEFDIEWLAYSHAQKWEWAFNHTKNRSYHDHNELDILHLHNGVHEAEHTKKRDKVPFYLLTGERLKEISQELAGIISAQLNAIFTQAAKTHGEYSSKEAADVLFKAFEMIGAWTAEAGFPLPYFATYQELLAKGKRHNVKNVMIALNKAMNDEHWQKQLFKAQKQMVEHIAIATGDVRKGFSPYISQNAFSLHRQAVKKSMEFIKGQILENIEDESERVELYEIWLKTNSNPQIRRLEMMNRLRGIEEWAEHYGYEALFLTLTAPSAYHAQHSKGGENKKWNGANPKQTQHYLNKVWQRYRAILKKRGIVLKGMRVAEPHHDATPHWHLLAFVEKEHVEVVEQLFRQKALEEDGDEKGALQHRCKVERCDKTKGSATGYISKYIAKNIEGFNADDLKDANGNISDEDKKLNLNENARRVRAWASLWGIRQFQFYGVGSISVWRELRKLTDGKVQQLKDKVVEDLFIAAHNSDYALYMDKQQAHGANAAVKTFYETTGENKNGEVTKKITGIYNALLAVKECIYTRLKNWAIKKKPANWEELKQEKVLGGSALCTQEQSQTEGDAVAPWTCVNNCNHSNSNGLEGLDTLSPSEFLAIHREDEKRLDFALKIRGIGSRWITDERKRRLICGQSVSFMHGNHIKFNGVEVEIC